MRFASFQPGMVIEAGPRAVTAEEIVEFASRLPENLKIRGNRLKFVLRELMKNRLPAPVVRRRKEGFDIPAHDWHAAHLAAWIRETLLDFPES